jgi:single-strand DNA-binding protein
MEKEVSFLDVETWGTLAQKCNEQARKGRSVRVVGRIRQDRWNDQEGKARSKIVVVAEHVEFRPMQAHEVNKNGEPEMER